MITRSEATRQQRQESEEDVPGACSTGDADRTAEPTATGTAPAQPPAFPLPTQQFLMTLMECVTRAQAEANRALFESFLTTPPERGGHFRASTPLTQSSTANQTGCGTGNFSRCTARFDGSARDAEVLEAFVDAVEVYKECAAVSDEHALRGLPMLLEGEAAVWWRGTRASVTSWPDAVTRLRAVYGVSQPAHKLLRLIFAAEQQAERAEVFVCRIRALIAKLPYKISEEMQVDMCYGLLHRRVKKRLPRESITTMDCLIDKARVTEDDIREVQIVTDHVSLLDQPINRITDSKNSSRVSPTICSNITDSNIPASFATPTTLLPSDIKTRRNRSRCSYCKAYGHVLTDCRNREKAVASESTSSGDHNNLTKVIRCYGCGKPGTVRSKCDICNTSAKSKGADFNSAVAHESVIESPQLMINVDVMGRHGVAIVDTGATHCIASPSLHRILVDSGVSFQKTQRTIRLADGSQLSKMVLTADVPITIEGRDLVGNFMVLPGNETKTLLGVNFMAEAGMVLDVTKGKWRFSDDPDRDYDFVHSYTLTTADSVLLNADAAVLSLRNEEGSKLSLSQKRTLNEVIVPGGIQVDPRKTAAIAGMSTPQNVKHLKCFLQTSSWFRRFIPTYAEIARPLTNLLKKTSAWQWEAEQQEAFERIKALLVSAPVLRQADETKPFALCTDSSGYCLGAVLMQGEGSDERPIEYASRLLTDAERNYSTTEREALAVVWAVSKFRGYIEGAKVTVRTDHQPLRWLMSQRSPSGRLARWALTLQEYDLHVEYTPGRSNVVADTLSRPACTSSSDCDVCLTTVDMPKKTGCDLRDNQLKDPEIRKIVEDLESDEPSRGRPWCDRGYTMSDGILYRYSLESDEGEDSCLVVPEHERSKVLADLHDAPTAGHFGIERTLSRIRTRFYWPGMRTYVTNYIKECVPCQRYKADTRKPAGLLQTPAVSRRFEVIAVDLFGPLVETPRGNRWVLIVEDVCTRWVELFPLESATSSECAQTLVNEVFLRYGVPRRLISDNGVQFVSEVMQQVCHVLGIDQALTPFYHPQANPIERKNRDLKPQLAILVGQDHDTWDLHLAAVRFAMNSAVTASTGFSPAYLTFGRELRAPSDSATDMRAILEKDNFVPSITPYLKRLASTLDDARDTHEKAQDIQKRKADKSRRAPPEFKVGDLVLLKTQGSNDAGRGQSAKFIPRRDGPYKVQKVVSPTTYLLENLQTGGSVGKYHVSHLTPFSGQVEPPVREKRKRGRPRRYM